MNNLCNEDIKCAIDCTKLLEYVEADIDFTGIDQAWVDRFAYGWRKDGMVMVVVISDNIVNYPIGYTQYDCEVGVARRDDFYLS